jgi:hypothetical protein
MRASSKERARRIAKISILLMKDKTPNIFDDTCRPEPPSLPIGLGIDEKRAKVEPTRR